MKPKTMTVGEMSTYAGRFIAITKINDQDMKDRRLAQLMTDLECVYDIPLLASNLEDSGVDPVALSFYRMVSAERSL